MTGWKSPPAQLIVEWMKSPPLTEKMSGGLPASGTGNKDVS